MLIVCSSALQNSCFKKLNRTYILEAALANAANKVLQFYSPQPLQYCCRIEF